MLNRAAVLTLFAVTLSLYAQSNDVVTGSVDGADRVRLSGDLPAGLRNAVDRGPRDGQAPVTGMLLLKRTEKKQAAFERRLADLNDPASAHYHHWLTAERIGSDYGPSANDLSSLSSWLSQEGFTVTGISPDGLTVAFAGTTAQADSAFKVDIHNLLKEGKPHYSATHPPSIPAALAPVIAHVIAFTDLAPKQLKSPARNQAGSEATAPTIASLSPEDMETIYDISPLLSKGITGKGVTIALVESGDQTSVGDWQIFRKTFELSRTYPFGTLTETHPQGSNSCVDPGQSGDDGVEEAIDVDAATMSAPNATLISAACEEVNGIPGEYIALANLLQSPAPPSVVSISYGEPEIQGVQNGLNEYKNMLFQNAAALGVSVFNSSGDTGASFDKESNTTYGIRNGGATSPWVTAVGGTDSGIAALREQASSYFVPGQLQNFLRAVSYIPEVPWNTTCASSVNAGLNGYPTTGPNSYCNEDPTLAASRLDASGGGPSSCATGTPSIAGVVSGTCKGYPKPVWQSLVGVPADGVRDVPDVAIFASGGANGYGFRICNSFSYSCLSNPSGWGTAGGTSFAAPLWAGIQALINQASGTTWGLANPQLYSLARSAYGPSGNPACSSSLGNQISASCIFHDVTLGDSVVPCLGTIDCYNSGGQYGVLSVSSTTLEPAYTAQTGYDFTTGIGTPDVTNLVNAWVSAFPATTAVAK